MNNINGNAQDPMPGDRPQQAMPSAQELMMMRQNMANAHNDVSQNPQYFGGQQGYHDNNAIMQRMQLLQQQQMAAMRTNPMMSMYMMQQNPMMAMASRDQMQHHQANQHALYSQLINTGNPVALQMLSQGYNPAVVLSIMSNPNLDQFGMGNSAVAEARAAQGQVGPAQKSGKKISKKTQHKNKPKRPLSAYNFFFREERARIIKEEEVKKEDAVEDETTKDDTKDAVTEDTAAAVKSEGDEDDAAKKGESGAKSDDTKPEKDGDDEKESTQVKTQTKFENLAKKIGERWRAIDKDGEEFKRYKKMADDDLERYKKDMDAFNKAEMRDTDIDEPAPKKKKKKKSKDCYV